ncbi:hypothetical protein [Escherichia phage 1720a-02]|nr:hypothetical protein [Escherichia phage 1720a-02]
MAGENIPRRPVAEGGQPDGTVLTPTNHKFYRRPGNRYCGFFMGEIHDSQNIGCAEGRGR